MFLLEETWVAPHPAPGTRHPRPRPAARLDQ